MPKTHFQEFIYGILMTFFMVVAMELYNSAVIADMLSVPFYVNAFREFLIMFPVCFVMGFFFIDRIAPVIAFRFVSPDEDKPLIVNVARASVTVAFMCPIMSFWATLFFQYSGDDFMPIWISTLGRNFPIAFFWQVMYCGPLVRFVFRHLFN